MSEQNKILAAMAALVTFTIEELTTVSRSNEATVNTVIRRFNSDQLQCSVDDGPRFRGGQLKIYKLSAKGREDIKTELRSLISNLASYEKFTRDEDNARKLGFNSLWVAAEGINKVEGSKNSEHHVHLRIKNIRKDLDRASIQSKNFDTAVPDFLEKIKQLNEKVRKVESKFYFIKTETDKADAQLEKSQFNEHADARVGEVDFYRNGKYFFNVVKSKKLYGGNALSEKNYFVEPTEFSIHKSMAYYSSQMFSNQNSLIHEIANFDKIKNSFSRKQVNENLINLRSHLRMVNNTLHKLQSSCARISIPTIYVYAAMQDKQSEVLALQIQAKFDTFLDAAHVTKRIDPNLMVGDSVLGVVNGAFLIVTVNSGGSKKEWRNAASQIKKIRSRGDCGVVVVDQSENINFLNEAGISRKNYLAMAQEKGFDSIVEFISS